MIKIRSVADLSAAACKQVKQDLFRGFNEWQGYHQHIAPVLDSIIEDARMHVLDSFLLKRGTKKFLNISANLLTKEEKSALYEARIILDAVYVLLLFQMEDVAAMKWSTKDQLLAVYPQFERIGEDEKQNLLMFRNMLCVSLLLIPAARNKKTIMAIAGRLQERPHDYVTGGGQKDETTWRVQIYEHEGGIQAQPRPERKPKLLLTRSTSDGTTDASCSSNGSSAYDASMAAFNAGIDGINIYHPVGSSSSTTSDCCSEADFLEVFSVLSAEEVSQEEPAAAYCDADFNDPEMSILLEAINFTDDYCEIMPQQQHDQHRHGQMQVSDEETMPPSLFCSLPAAICSFVCGFASSDSTLSVTTTAALDGDDDVSVGSRRSRESDSVSATKRMRREQHHYHH